MRQLRVGRTGPDDFAALTHDDPRGQSVDARTREQQAADAAIVSAALTALYGPDSDLHQALGLIPTKGATP